MIHPFRIHYLPLICAQFVQKFSILHARSQQPVSLCVSVGVGVVSLVWLYLPHPHLLLISSSSLHACHPSSSSARSLKGGAPSPLLARSQFKWGQVWVFGDVFSLFFGFFFVCFYQEKTFPSSFYPCLHKSVLQNISVERWATRRW